MLKLHRVQGPKIAMWVYNFFLTIRFTRVGFDLVGKYDDITMTVKMTMIVVIPVQPKPVYIIYLLNAMTILFKTEQW